MVAGLIGLTGAGEALGMMSGAMMVRVTILTLKEYGVVLFTNSSKIGMNRPGFAGDSIS